MSYYIIPGLIVFIICMFFGYTSFMEFMKYAMMPALGGAANMSNDSAADMMTALVKFYGIFGGTYFLYSIFIIGANGACVKAIALILDNQPVMPREVAREALSKLAPLIFTSMVAGLLIVLPGLLCCYIPGLVLLVYLCFLPQAVMLENKYFFQAIGRSFSLVKKNFWMIVLVLIIFYFLYSTITSVVAVPVYIVPYTKMIGEMLKNEGQMDPMFMGSLMNDFGAAFVIIMILVTIVSIFYMIMNNILLTLKYYNIKNLREGSFILDKLDDTTQTGRDAGTTEGSQTDSKGPDETL